MSGHFVKFWNSPKPHCFRPVETLNFSLHKLYSYVIQIVKATIAVHSMFNSGKIHLFKVNSRNIWERCDICSKLTTKTQERCHWHRFGIFIVNFDNFFTPFPNVSIVDIEHKFVCWKVYYTQKSLQALSIKANKLCLKSKQIHSLHLLV